MSRMLDLLTLSFVPRWAIVPISQQQSVSDHCFRVAVISMEICDRMKIEAANSAKVMRWALIHDGPECISGCIPSPFKRKFLNNAELHWAEGRACPWINAELPQVPAVLELVKMADLIDAWVWIKRFGHGCRSWEDDNITIEQAYWIRMNEHATRVSHEWEELNTMKDVLDDLVKEIG